MPLGFISQKCNWRRLSGLCDRPRLSVVVRDVRFSAQGSTGTSEGACWQEEEEEAGARSQRKQRSLAFWAEPRCDLK